MCDGRALLKAVLDDPDDDLPRLAYADWCDEQGDDARAEFIRVQIERCRIPSWDLRQSELAARERRLLSAHAEQWMPRRTMRVYFRRGFMERVEASLADLLDLADELAPTHPILDIGLWQVAPVRASDLKAHPLWSRARVLRWESERSQAAIEALIQVCSHTEGALHRLALPPSGLDASSFRRLCRQPALHEVSSIESWQDTVLLETLADPSVRLPALRAVSCRETFWPSSLGALLDRAEGLGWSLDLGSHGDVSPRITDHFLKSLRSGSIRSAYIDDTAYLDALLEAPTWGRLAELAIFLVHEPQAGWVERLSLHPGFAGLRSLTWAMLDVRGELPPEAFPGMQDLEELTLFDLNDPLGACMSRMMKAISRQDACPRLRHFGLRSHELPAEDFAVFLESPTAARLRGLHLMPTADATLDALSGCRSMPALNELWLSHVADPLSFARRFTQNSAFRNMAGLWFALTGEQQRTDEADIVDTCRSTGLTQVAASRHGHLPYLVRMRLGEILSGPDARLNIIEPTEPRP